MDAKSKAETDRLKSEEDDAEFVNALAEQRQLDEGPSDDDLDGLDEVLAGSHCPQPPAQPERRRDAWKSPRVYFSILALPALSAAITFFVYGDAFPWVRASLVMTLVTALAAFAAAGRSHSHSASQDTGFLYPALGVPIVFMLLYPGLGALGLSSDSNGGLVVFALMVLHGIGFFQIRHAVEAVES